MNSTHFQDHEYDNACNRIRRFMAEHKASERDHAAFNLIERQLKAFHIATAVRRSHFRRDKKTRCVVVSVPLSPMPNASSASQVDFDLLNAEADRIFESRVRLGSIK